jgi:hypothetical protein
VSTGVFTEKCVTSPSSICSADSARQLDFDP